MPKIEQHLHLNDRDFTWAVDPHAAAQVMAWVEREPATFDEDIRGMAAYFPHWLLVGGGQERPLRCGTCGLYAVPLAGAIRCPQCRLAQTATSLLWLGQIPVLARPEPEFVRRQTALRQAGFGEVMTGGTTYLLVPLRVHYPTEWPNIEPRVFYARRWLKALGLPEGSSSHHLLSGGRACIFAGNQWQVMPIHAVLQQRMVNHVVSLFKIAAGQRPAEAFIGRIHHQAWQPER